MAGYSSVPPTFEDVSPFVLISAPDVPGHFSHYLSVAFTLLGLSVYTLLVYAPLPSPFVLGLRFLNFEGWEIGRVLMGYTQVRKAGDIRAYPTEVKGSRTLRREWNHQFRFSLSPPASLFSFSFLSSVSLCFFFSFRKGRVHDAYRSRFCGTVRRLLSISHAAASSIFYDDL